MNSSVTLAMVKCSSLACIHIICMLQQDKACEDVDYGVQSLTSDDSESGSEQEEDERKRQQAILEKEKEKGQ